MTTPLPKKPNSPKKHARQRPLLATTLYEDESGWGITSYQGYTHAAMTHKCKNEDGVMTPDMRLNARNQTNVHLTGSLSGKHRCSWCRAIAPDHIITLWTLFNWDKM